MTAIETSTIDILHSTGVSCSQHFRGMDDLRHICDEFLDHETGHFCKVHGVAEDPDRGRELRNPFARRSPA